MIRTPRQQFAPTGRRLALLEAMLRQEGISVPPALRIAPRGYGSPAPLSFAQQRLWFLDQLEPGQCLYNVPIAMKLAGRLCGATLEASLAELIRRHESLRATFPAADGRPVQVIAPGVSFSLPILDLSGLPADEREA